MPATAQDLVALAENEDFLRRATVAFANVAHSVLTPGQNPPPATDRLKQLEVLRTISGLAKLRELVNASTGLIVGAPEVIAAGANVTDADLVKVAQRILLAFQEFATLGGRP